MSHSVGQYKTWTQDSRLHHGLDSGINKDLIFGLVFRSPGVRNHARLLSSNVLILLDVMSSSYIDAWWLTGSSIITVHYLFQVLKLATMDQIQVSAPLLEPIYQVSSPTSLSVPVPWNISTTSLNVLEIECYYDALQLLPWNVLSGLRTLLWSEQLNKRQPHQQVALDYYKINFNGAR